MRYFSMSIDWLGLTAKDLAWYQMSIRAAIVFVIALALVRLSGMRTFGTKSAFDVVISITLGGILGRCIMGHYPFFESLVACLALVSFHRLASFFASRFELFRKLSEGDAITLYSKGARNNRSIKKYEITDQELQSAIRQMGLSGFDQVDSIWLEPSGRINAVKKQS